MKNYIAAIIKHRKLVLFLTALVTFGLFSQLKSLQVISNPERVLPQSNPFVITANIVEEIFGNNPLIQKPNLYAVLGGDRTFFENFNVNAQIMYRHAFGFQDPARISDPNIRTVASIESIITNQQFQDQAGMTLRPSYKMFNETLEMEVAFVRWFGKGESLIRPKVTYAFTDKFKGIVGGEIYSGPPDSTFGRLKHASSAFAELRYNF